jgi:hypothetical protein
MLRRAGRSGGREGTMMARRVPGCVPGRVIAVFGVAFAALAIADVRVAQAGCHGGSGGGTGGGGHGGSHAGQLHTTPACEDDSDVVGLRHCSKFGDWATDLGMPQIIIEAGAVVRRFASLLDRQTGTVTHGVESFSYRVLQTARSRPLDTAVLSSLRAGVALPHGLYTALEVDLGGLARPGATPTEMMSTGVFGSPDLRQDHGFIVDSVGAVGVHGTVGSGGLGVELAGGMRGVSYSFHSSYHDCEQSTSVRALAAIAEARVRGELWLGPWVTAGVTVGTSVLDRNSWMGGVYLGVHTRAFGGER